MNRLRGYRRAARLLPVAVLLAGAAVSTVPAVSERNENRREVMYAQIAAGTGLPQFCALIYPAATGGVGLGAPGRQTWYTRSRCYLDVAVRTGDARWCDEVRSHDTIFLSGGAYSRSACLEQVAARQDATAAHQQGVGPVDAKLILLQMGYTEAMIPVHYRQAPSEYEMWIDFLESVAKSSDFIGRIGRLTDYSRVSSVVNTTTCEAPFILGPNAMGRSGEQDCCIDVTNNGVCDETEFKDNPMRAEHLVLESAPGRPPRSLCGDREFDIEVLVHNRGPEAVRPGSGYLTLSPINPAAFGLGQTDFYKLLPPIPPGGSAAIRFERLRYRDSRRLDRGGGSPPRAIVCLPGPANACTQLLQLEVNRRPPNSPPCLTEAALRAPAGPCRAPAITDREPGGAGGCCLDVDGDARCDDREWDAGRAWTGQVQVTFRRKAEVQETFTKQGWSMTFEEGVPTSVEMTVHNRGPAAFGRHDGFVKLDIDRRLLPDVSESALYLPLPALDPGKETVLTFQGLRYTPPPGAIPFQGGDLHATVCMRDGCVGMAMVTASFRLKDAERKLAQRNARPAAGKPGLLFVNHPEALAVAGGVAPAFSTRDIAGANVPLMTFRRRNNVLLVFCPDTGAAACRARLSSLQAARAELSRLDVVILVIAAEWSKEALADIRRGFESGAYWLNDPGLEISSCYARRAAGETRKPRPMIVLVDKQGNVAGAMDDDRGVRPTTADLLRLLREMTVPSSR